MKRLVIAEKPSVARDIARVLKCSTKGDGCLSNDEYVVTWAVGHLVTLCEPDDYKPEWKKWRREDLPIIPEKIKTKPIPSAKKQLKIIQSLAKNSEVDELICATDSGREGELIFRYIYDIIKCRKPFKRLWISSMTDAAIRAGFERLKDGVEYDNLYMSAKCRSEADWLVGINASRAYTLKYNALLSIGRVQTPTLAVIVQRQKEIDQFKPQDYWEVEANFGGYKGTWIDLKTNELKIYEKERADAIIAAVKGKTAVVSKIDDEEKRVPPPLLYDLTELQRDCNKKYSFTAQKTLSLAQDLYEKRKMVTYPRTDSRYISDDMVSKIPIILNKIAYVDEYTSYANYIKELDKLPITKRIVDNSKITDHHAIIPTEVNININSLSQDEYRIYDLIVRRFLAVFFPHYIYNITKIITSCADNLFLTKGNTIKQAGWTSLNRITGKEKPADVLPNVKVNDIVEIKSIKSVQKKTAPPQAYNEASLLSAMENAGRFVEDENLKEQLKDSGLGTPATRAAMIERLITVGYITRKGKALVPTEKGMKLIEVVPAELKSPETTGKWERALNLISRGDMKDEKFMGSILRYVSYIVNQSLTDQGNIIFPEENAGKKGGKGVKGGKGQKNFKSFGKCLLCGGAVRENTKAFYCENWKQGCKFTVWKNSLQNYSYMIDEKNIMPLLSDKVLYNQEIINPKTNEKQIFDIKFQAGNSGRLMLEPSKSNKSSKS